MANDWEDAPGSWEDAPTGRKTPKQMKIGREGFGEAFGKVLEEATPFARKAAAFGSYPRQLYEGAKQRLGFGDPEAIRAQRMLQEREPGAATAGGVASMVPLSMIPGLGTIAGQTALGGATGLLQPTEAGESVGKNVALSALTAGGLGLGMKGVGMAAKPFLSRAGAKAAATASQEAVKGQTIAEAQAAGYVFPPTAIGGGRAAKVMESVGGGKATLAQEASLRNQTITNKIARAEAGLAPNEAISEGSLSAARNKLAAPYREVEQLASGHPLTQPPFKPMAATLDELKQARGESNLYWKAYGRLPLPSLLKRAQRMDNKVDLLEKSIDAVATSLGKPDLVDRLASARTALAKNYNVEQALNLGTGDVDAKVIGNLLNKKGIKGVTGGLQTIGKVQQAFPRFVREAPSGESAPGVSYLRPLVTAGALGLAGYEGHERYGLSPYWMAAAAMPLVSGPARNIALSRIMQGAPTYAPGMAAQLTGAATSPLAQKLIPLSAVAAQQEQR